MIPVYPKTKIYILAPSDYVTGGAECLHQLSHKLIKFNYKAFVYYIPKIKESFVEAYKKYDVKKAERIEDDEKNIVIIPESWIDKIKNFKNIRKCIYWLSVDNVKRNTTLPIGKINKKIPFFRKKFPKTYELLKSIYGKMNRRGKILFDFNNPKNMEVIHLAQSYYAKDFLEKRGVKKIYILSDYINKDFLYKGKIKKENLVAYNPRKGWEITEKIIKNSPPHIKYVKLFNMAPFEISKTLAKCMVYIDFGDHPGKDRIPREAVIHDCCVIVGKRGSAKFYEDIPIKEEYKFSVEPLNIDAIIGKINECIKDYKNKIKDFKIYKRIVKNDEKNFEKEIKEIFFKIDNGT
ncbi:MAG: hypothetical protein QXU40_00785 [Candidatus Pacearchaeota archaeon]